MISSPPLIISISILVVITSAVWGALFFKLKNSLLRIPLAAIFGALLFQVVNYIYIGFLDPFFVIAFFVSIPITGGIAFFLELLLELKKKL